MFVNSLIMLEFQKGILEVTGIHVLENGKTILAKNLISNFDIFFRNSDSKQQELLGKEKDFAYSGNS